MSRRDTIIIAVLVNAGLLIVLFATAMRSDKKTPQSASLAESRSLIENPIALTSSSEEEDQIDTLLDNYGTLPTLSSASEEILFANDMPPAFLADEANPSFGSPTQSLTTTSSSLQGTDPVAALQPAPVSNAPRVVNVTVKKGDVLEKIAKANGSSVSGIMKANNLSSSQLKIGQVLKVPVKDGATPSKNTATPSEGDYYTVKEGDSPWLIASKNNVKLDELLRLNNLDDQKAKRLRPGDRLRIR